MTLPHCDYIDSLSSFIITFFVHHKKSENIVNICDFFFQNVYEKQEGHETC